MSTRVIKYNESDWYRFKSIDHIPDAPGLEYAYRVLASKWNIGIFRLSAGRGRDLVVYIPYPTSRPVACYVEECGDHVRVYIPEGVD